MKEIRGVLTAMATPFDEGGAVDEAAALRLATYLLENGSHGLVISGTSPDGRLVEFVELPRDVHPYFVATQAHPELRSRPARPHPLFRGLVAAALARVAERSHPVRVPEPLGTS